MKKTFAILLALVMVFGLLAGCGGSDKEDTGTTKKGSAAPAEAEVVTVETGKYQAIYCAIDGEEYDCDQDWLEIEADGVGVLVFEGADYSMEWEYSNSLFTFEDEDGSTFVGSYSEGTIAGILDDNVQYVFEKESTGGKKPAAEKPAEPEEGGFEPVSATIGGYEVSVVGAELFTDTDDKDGIRVYWDFTNTSDETIYPYCDLSVEMEQEGFELNTTYVYSDEDVPEYGNDSRDIRPGVSIRCISEYNCKADGEPISFTIYDWYDEDDALTVEFDPMNLPGRPAEELEVETVSDPEWTEGMAVEGYVGEDAYVVIDTAEVVDGWDNGEEVIRVYFEFTNESEEAASMWWATYYRAFQDGIELTEDWADEDVEADDNMSLDIEPGETIYCSVCWELRSDSPVEIEVYDTWTEDYIGCVFEVE